MRRGASGGCLTLPGSPCGQASDALPDPANMLFLPTLLTARDFASRAFFSRPTQFPIAQTSLRPSKHATVKPLFRLAKHPFTITSAIRTGAARGAGQRETNHCGFKGATGMNAGNFIHRSAAMAELVAQAEKAARGTANALIEGAPGIGKAALARFMHETARGNNLVCVSCAAGDDPAEALATHAQSGATLLLHDIDELSAPSQAELAMALRSETRAWIISASARNLSDAVAAGTFRADLYYRLAVVKLEVPSLAGRLEDISALAAHFADIFAAMHGVSPRTLTPHAHDKLAHHSWPGNVRELENVMYRAVLFAEGETIRTEDINFATALADESDPRSGALVGRTVADVERDLILQTLRHCSGNRTQAAALLGISVRTLRNKIRQYHEEGTEVPAFSRAA